MANSTACKHMSATSNGIFQGDNPLDFSVGLLIVQICFIVVLTRVLAFLLKPLRQPRVIAEIIGGVLLGPSALSKNATFKNNLFPDKSLTVLESFADVGLLFFLFMVGLELDLRSIMRTGRQALLIAAAGISLPFAGGVGVSFVLHATINKDVKFITFLVFMGVAMSITAFPVLARILAERKLLTTEVGKLAMSAAAVNDVVAWIFLALAVALSGSGKSPIIAVWVLLCGAGFVIFMFVAVRPLMAWIISLSPEDQPVREIYVAITLVGVLMSSFMTDFIGIHGIFGAFVFGLIIPKDGPFAGLLIEKIEDFITVLMLPLYFASSGLKTNIGSIKGARSGGLLILVVATACLGKIIGTTTVSFLYGENFITALTLGFLMNTKGLVELIVLNIGRQRKVLTDEVFAIMVLMALFTTFITTPVVMALYKPARKQVPYKRRRLDFDKPTEDLRILACVYGMKNVPSILNLVEGARGTNKEALQLYILHMVELSERSSSIMMVQKARKDGHPFWNRNSSAIVDGVLVAFSSYGQLNKVKVRPMTAISNLHTMHEDICGTAANKRATIVIVPFHKHMRVDGVLETTAPGFQAINARVLQHAPCSVGLLVDRGLGGSAQLSPSSVDHNVAVLFFGGADDREALVFGYRMAEHPGIKFTLIHFKLSPNHNEVVIHGLPDMEMSHRRSSVDTQRRSSVDRASYQVVLAGLDEKREEALDQECLSKFREMKGAADKSTPKGEDSSTMVYEEIEMHDPVDAVLKVGLRNKFGLIIVGRGRRPSPLIAGLAARHATCAELGPIGDVLASSAEIRASVLVVQQYDPSLAPPTHVADS